MKDVRKSILVFIDWFEPGFKAGGPIRSAVNFARHLQHHYRVFIFTSDRDLGAKLPYENIQTNQWIPFDEAAKVFYASPNNLNWRSISGVIGDINPDYLYLNSLFSKHFTIYPLLINRANGWKSQTILAPRGMLRQSALQYKSVKKKLFLRAFRLLAVHRRIYFQATDDTEFKDVKGSFGDVSRVVQIPNFPAYVPPYPGSQVKRIGGLSIVFVGRLHPIKNLHFLLSCLESLKGNVLLTVIGSEEDKAYVAQCRDQAASLPANVKVTFLGEKPNRELPAIIEQHHILGLPTQGENFGHAIFEGLSVGRPVLISDQTPWRGLETAKAGWDVSLQDIPRFKLALQTLLDMDQKQYDEWSLGAWMFASEFSEKSNALTKYTSLFQ